MMFDKLEMYRGNRMKIKNLKWWDVMIISMILFGGAIYSSTSIFFDPEFHELANLTEFSKLDNLFGIFTILIELSIAFLYLKWRRFDFSQWKYEITWKKTVLSVFLFILIALSLDAFDILFSGWGNATAYVGTHGYLYVLESLDMSLIVFSLLNGFYEEIFFLGVCFSVEEKYRPWAFAYSLLIRFSFHTYQGMAAALGIGFVLGILYYFLFLKSDKNLYPFMLAHSFADIVGVSILSLL